MDTNKVITEKELFVNYALQVLPFFASKLSGKMLKRFDLFDDKELLKKELKELIYENSRDLMEIFKSYSDGIEMSFFHFNKPKNKES